MKFLRLFVLLLLISCGDKNTPTTDGINYLNEILDVMEKNSINKKTIDWPSFRSEVLASANGANSKADVYPALYVALDKLGDQHSFYSNGATYISASTKLCISSSTAPEPIDNIGYLRIQAFTRADGNAFADSLQSVIESQDKADLAGWIIDLRGNGGGNMWPMLAGVGPVLGEGVAGYFIDPDEIATPYEYKAGSSVYNNSNVNTVTPPYVLIKTNPKVALLIDQGTASSGEAIAVAFVGRANTRIFGTGTCGLSTANGNFTLSDGAILYLTIAVMADRNKDKKGGSIEPDVVVPGSSDVVPAATEWLNAPQ